MSEQDLNARILKFTEKKFEEENIPPRGEIIGSIALASLFEK